MRGSRLKRECVNNVFYTKQAREDLLDIWVYIAPRNAEAVADRVYDSIEQACKLLALHPQLGVRRPEIADDARSLVVERWLVLYRLMPEGVQVVRIIDGARDITRIQWPLE